MRLFSLIAIALLILVLIPGLSISEEKLTELEKKELQELEAEQKKYEEYIQLQNKLKKLAGNFNKSLSEGPIGRFQAVPVSSAAILILDTKEGHLWIVGLGKIIYAGFVYHGTKAGDVINKYKIGSM